MHARARERDFKRTGSHDYGGLQAEISRVSWLSGDLNGNCGCSIESKC